MLQRVSFSGYLSFAFFLVVMFAGALNTGWKVTQNWMRIRAQLSIIGSILILPHALLYLIHILPSLSFFMTMRGKDLALSLGYLLAGVAAFVVMLPLFVTSFKKIRQKMKAVRWKKLQKWAYLFYALIYAHVVLAILLAAEVDWFRLAAYTAIFAAYLVFKKIKYASGSIKGKMADKPIPTAKAGGPSGAARV